MLPEGVRNVTWCMPRMCFSQLCSLVTFDITIMADRTATQGQQATAQKPGIPQGTRDFSADVVRKRRYLFDVLRTTFELYGFEPLETPAVENLSTLNGKYGEEGDRLIFKILNNGLHEKKDKDRLNADWARLLDRPASLSSITERALRYDLTIPFARYVAMNHGQLPLPFRRYQIQPVWRADRPQRGRYREFWQCDCDVVGTSSLIAEAELLCIYAAAFGALQMPDITIRINSRKLLAALAQAAGHPDRLSDITVALDKLDKIGWTGVSAELSARGISSAGVETVGRIIQVSGSNAERMDALSDLLGQGSTTGVEELRTTLAHYSTLCDPMWTAHVVVDVSLARGLDYYTGVIVEVGTSAVKMGSLGGGGRYDDLTGLFGVKGLSGVGISFGIDRIYDVFEELALFPQTAATGTRALVISLQSSAQAYALKTVQRLRWSGIRAEVYPDIAKPDKPLRYASRRGIPFAVIVGEEELAAGQVSVKNLETGEQRRCTLEEAAAMVF